VPVTVPAASKVRENPASYDDHFSQARLFWKSMTPVEKEHIVNAYSFELGKCYEQAVKERELRVLANVDAELCALVAAGLGLPAPEATEPAAEVTPSPAVSQIGQVWPPDGRLIGIVVDADDPTSLDGLHTLRQTITAGGMVPLIIAARGGQLDEGLVAQRTFLTARSIEFDALLLAAAPPPAPDAIPARDDKAGAPATAVDPRVVLMVQECYRHAKVIGVWGNGEAALVEAGCSAGDLGIAVGDTPADVFAEVQTLLGTHRVWDRFPATIA
jgi:catalase